MSLSGALSAALSGIKTSTTAVQLISANVSNAQTEGYSSKSITLAQSTTAAGTGGVEIVGYTRKNNEVLRATYNSSTSNAAFLSTQDNYMGSIKSILDFYSDTPSLSAAVADFQTAWTNYATSTDDATAQQAVISAGEKMASAISTIAAQVTDLQDTIESDIDTTVSTLNANLLKIQDYNSQIVAARAAKRQTGDLEDARDRAVNEIADTVGVQIMERGDGQIALYTPGGTAMIDGEARTFSSADGVVTNEVGADVSGALTGGKLEAQIAFISDTTSTTTSSSATGNGINVINKIKSQLQNFANMFVNSAAGGFADAYDSATTGSGELASSFFTCSLDTNGLPDISSFGVNSALTSGTSTLKQSGAQTIADLFTDTTVAIDMSTTPDTLTNVFSATGITTRNKTYTGVMSSILSGFQQMSSTISGVSDTATSQKTYYENQLSSETGVDTDSELVKLTSWQNSYSASAHVISTIQEMFKTLENMI